MASTRFWIDPSYFQSRRLRDRWHQNGAGVTLGITPQETPMFNSTDPLDSADEFIIIVAKVIVIGMAAVYYDELAGLFILLLVALTLLKTGMAPGSEDSLP
jgi:hypothetical protein